MKLLKLYESILNEGASPILYHFTYLDRLANILSSNALYLTPAVGAKAENTRGKHYFLSFSRTKSTKHGYGYGFTRNGSVRIKIDGQKLGNNYKVIPVDYWQYPKTPEFMKNASSDEMEDRVISNKNEIPNASKYIVSVDVLSTEPVDKLIITKAKELGVKINIYNNLKDFTNGDPSKSVQPETVDNSEENDSEYTKNQKIYRPLHNLSNTLAIITYKNPEAKDKLLSVYRDKFNGNEDIIKQLSDKLDEKHKVLNYDLYDDDYSIDNISRSVGYEIENEKKSSDGYTRYVINELIKELKKTNSKGINDYLKHKIYLGKKTQRDYNKELNSYINKLIINTYDEMVDSGRDGYKVDGEYIENVLLEPTIKAYLENKIKLIQRHTSNYIMNNKDGFEYGLLSLDSAKMREEVLDDDATMQKLLDSVTENEHFEVIKYPLETITRVIDREGGDELQRIKTEMNNIKLNR